MNFSDKLKQARTAANMSQEQLATATGISRRSIAEYETNPDIQVRKKNLHSLAEALNVSYEYLANDEITDPHYCAEIEPYIDQAREAYGDNGAQQLSALMNSPNLSFAGGSLSAEDRESFYQALTDAFLYGKAEAARQKAERKSRKK